MIFIHVCLLYFYFSKSCIKFLVALARLTINPKAFLTLLVALIQDDDEADTVGCCTLKVENVKAIAPNKLEV